MPSPRPSPTSKGSALPDFVARQFDHTQAVHDHRQLYNILERGIRESVLAPGSRLPPSRQLAQTLGIARNTVVHVYQQLTLEGYLQAQVGRGTFVSEGASATSLVWTAPSAVNAPTSPRPLSRRGRSLLSEAGAARLQWGAFTPGVPDVRLFPHETWRRLNARVWRSPAPELLSYATEAGDPHLRRSLAEYLQGTRGVVCTPEQVVITSGTQQSLHLIAQLLADPGDKVWLEDPGYWGARSVFRALGLKPIGIPLDGEGMAPTPSQWRQAPKLMFLSPSHQYPTGVVMSHGRRRRLLDYAATRASWVIEDDYDSEFRYGARPLPALQGLDSHGRVIYLGTFSKTLYPALRLAYLVLPPDLVDPFSRALSELYREGQTPQQAVLAQFLAQGHYTSHIRRMRSVYAARHDTLIASIKRHFGSHLPVIGGDAGLHLVLGLPAHLDDVAVAQRVASLKVITRPLSLYHLQQPAPSRGLLLGYGAVEENAIPANFARLAHAVEQFL